MLPLIGITTDYAYDKNKALLNRGYFRAVEAAGGIPVAILSMDDESVISRLVERIDGIILSGGPDVDPFYYGENPNPRLKNICPIRDSMEISLAREMRRAGKPILGICRGIQIFNVAFGGSLFQDIPSEVAKALKHDQDAPKWYGSHKIEISQNSLLFKILGKRYIRVNSYHHQAVKKIAVDFKLVATAPDGIIEAIELNSDNLFCMGVQWHPEEMWEKDSIQLRIFQAFIEAVKQKRVYREEKL